MNGLAGGTVLEVAVKLPMTTGRHATVADARVAFEDTHVHMLLITEDGRLLGTLVREDLPPHLDEAAPALDHAVLRGRTIGPDVPAEQARQLLLARAERRLAVVDHNQRLLGLLCLKRRLHGFCRDDDVRARGA